MVSDILIHSFILIHPKQPRPKQPHPKQPYHFRAGTTTILLTLSPTGPGSSVPSASSARGTLTRRHAGTGQCPLSCVILKKYTEVKKSVLLLSSVINQNHWTFRFCYSCIITWLNEGRTCPKDNSSLGEGDIFPDAMAHREILQLSVSSRGPCIRL